MNQLAMPFDSLPAPGARQSDPWVSHEAARAAKQFQLSHAQIILHCLEQYGPQSKDQIAARTNLRGDQVDRRMVEMQRAGQIELTGKYRLSAAGHRERVWRANA